MPRTLLLAALIGCSSHPPMPTVESVDLERFMGDWYVIAHIPADIEKNAFNAIESYRLADDGTIETTYTFNEGSFDGEAKEYNPKGFVRDRETNAKWGMQFVWPIKADYRIVYLDPEYRTTIIGRTKRDYVWVMAREKKIDEARYQSLVDRVGELGYDLTQLRRVPQR